MSTGQTTGDPTYKCSRCGAWVYLHGWHDCQATNAAVLIDPDKHDFVVKSLEYNADIVGQVAAKVSNAFGGCTIVDAEQMLNLLDQIIKEREIADIHSHADY